VLKGAILYVLKINGFKKGDKMEKRKIGVAIVLAVAFVVFSVNLANAAESQVVPDEDNLEVITNGHPATNQNAIAQMTAVEEIQEGTYMSLSDENQEDNADADDENIVIEIEEGYDPDNPDEEIVIVIVDTDGDGDADIEFPYEPDGGLIPIEGFPLPEELEDELQEAIDEIEEETSSAYDDAMELFEEWDEEDFWEDLWEDGDWEYIPCEEPEDEDDFWEDLWEDGDWEYIPYEEPEEDGPIMDEEDWGNLQDYIDSWDEDADVNANE